jgi:short-subunit dehydrogenase
MPARTDARPVVVITGASAGIGKALALVFARHGHALVLVARRAGKLKSLAAAIEKEGHPRPLVLSLDIAKPGAAERLRKALAGKKLEVQYLVNNAGFGLFGRFAELPRRRQLAMADLNVRALTELTLSFVDSIAKHKGGLLNVASVVSFLPGPGMAMYYATKHFVLSLTESLHQELKPHGVRVTALCPGPVPTEFQAVAGLSATSMPAVMTVSAENVAEAGYRGLMAGRPRVIPGFVNKLLTKVYRIMPRTLFARLCDISQSRRMSRHGHRLRRSANRT